MAANVGTATSEVTMSVASDAAPTRWLAQALPGETFRVERMLFGVLRDLCFGLGLAEGDVVRCRSSSGTIVLLETSSGRTVLIDRDWARFIEITDPGPRRSPSNDDAGIPALTPRWNRGPRHQPRPGIHRRP